MIIDSACNLYKYLDSDDFTLIEGFFKKLSEYPVGAYQLSEKIQIKVIKTKSHYFESTKIESHYHHIDIQIPLGCSEHMKIYSSEGAVPLSPYDESKDVIFYQHLPPVCYADVLIRDSNFILIDPNELHQCQIADGEESDIYKLVVKIRCNHD